MYNNVPIFVPVCLRSLSFEVYFANPKSASFGPPFDMRIFCGFMSRWIILWSYRNETAETMPLIIFKAYIPYNGPFWLI